MPLQWTLIHTKYHRITTSFPWTLYVVLMQPSILSLLGNHLTSLPSCKHFGQLHREFFSHELLSGNYCPLIVPEFLFFCCFVNPHLRYFDFQKEWKGEGKAEEERHPGERDSSTGCLLHMPNKSQGWSLQPR
uniref:Uncharacterized protein n=1 Tax=Pipistrellus kuhlii TaxID=59472 RepID=A0A7J7ZK15_PIPKU|nr:hypothetical protein mPipKuh1_009594 [Pipistrellus kuhlii]